VADLFLGSFHRFAAGELLRHLVDHATGD